MQFITHRAKFNYGDTVKYRCKQFFYFISITLVMSTLTGCGNNVVDQNLKQTTSTVEKELSLACNIALAPHKGTSASDQKIIALQGQLVQLKQKNIMEKLGWAYVAKAKQSFDPGYYKLAEQTVICMEEKLPDSLNAKLLQGHILQNLHRFAAAETIAHRLVTERGRWFDYALLGDALMEQGQLDQAIIAYQEMANQNPGPSAYNRAANIRWLKGDLAGAMKLMEMSASSLINTDNEAAAWTLVKLAEYEFQRGNTDLSNKYLNAVLSRQANYAPALLLQGKIKLAQPDYSQAVTILTRAMQLNPLPQYQWALIEAMHAAGDTLGKSRIEKQLFATGESEDRRTFALYLASTGQNISQAISLAKQELQARRDVFTLDTLAWALRAAKQYQKASILSEQALSEGTQSAHLFYHAGVIAAESAKPKQAKQWLLKAQDLQQTLLPSERKHIKQILVTL